MTNTERTSQGLRIEADDFARRFSMRGENLMWFLGAGASTAGGVPTGKNMIWEFKQTLFASQLKTSPKDYSDLSNPVIRNRLQSHIDSLGRLPSIDSPEEYAMLFEEVYPAETDRRAYLDAKLAGAKPSYGHLALATLMRARRARLIWTTNFDTLIADACARVYGTTSALTTVALDAPDMAVHVIQNKRWPLEVKLHGDFRFRRLKNTPDELRHQDSRLRKTLVESCRQFGLVVAGYSGRDNSIMDALEEAANSPGAFPAGLFWLHRGDEPPLPRVVGLLSQAKDSSVEAALVSIENFDEVLRDLLRLIQDLDTAAIDALAAERRPWSAAPTPTGRRGWPVVRLNALPVIQVPSVCRRVVCNIGGTAEVREAVERAGSNVIAVRSQSGVLAFGSDTEIRRAFEPFGLSDFDMYTLDPARQRYDSTERGLLRVALTTAIESNIGMKATRRRHEDLLVPRDPAEGAWTPLKQLVGNIAGSVSGHPELEWYEGVSLRLGWADDSLWLLFEPRTVFDGMNACNKSVAADFARERTVQRYNRELNSLLDFWSAILAQGEGDLRALAIGDGIDAVFKMSSVTGFSRRLGA